jgi:hypothetical protein
MALVWLALAVSLVAVAVAATMSTRRGIALYRDAKRLSTVTGQELESIERRTAEIERHLTAAEHSSEARRAAMERLARSRARLNVLLAAASDVRASVNRITSLLPRK